MDKNLIFVIDEKNSYARHLGVTLISVLENSNVLWNIFIIYLNLSQDSKYKLEEISSRYNCKINFIKLSEESIKDFKLQEGTYLNKVVYGRLMCPHLIHQDKAIYLDCDMVVLKSLETIYDIELGDKLIGVVKDAKADQELSGNRLKMNNINSYFNAGLMLMDLKKLRESGKFQEVIEFCKTTNLQLTLNEQDALNIIFEDNYKELPKEYNVTHGTLEEKKYKNEEIGLIHYTGEIKPWDGRCLNPLKDEYKKYLQMTPWKNYPLENNSIKDKIKTNFITFKLNTRNVRYKLKNLWRKN